MDAKRCDRCGRFYNRDYYEHFKLISYKSIAFGQQLDLCKNCAKDFEKWLKKVRNNDETHN